MQSISDDIKTPIWEKAYTYQKSMNDQFAATNILSDYTYVYNSTIYAATLYRTYLEKYLNGPKRTLFLGITPGPWGSCQTGIPFACPKIVKTKFKFGTIKEHNEAIKEAIIETKLRVHPKKPVEGLGCKKTDNSGKRLWQLLDQFGDSETFFTDNFLLNYCPLTFFDENGNYLGLERLKVEILEEIQKICDENLLKFIKLLDVKTIICLGKFTTKQVNRIKKNNVDKLKNIKLIELNHPCRRYPENFNWFDESTEKLKGILNSKIVSE